VELEITPEPTDEERAAIAAALDAQLRSVDGSAWWAAGLPDESDGDDADEL